VKPTAELEDEFRALAEDYVAEADERSCAYYRKILADFPAFLHRLADDESGVELPPGWVPHTLFCLVRNGKDIVGQSDLRHHLTPELEIEGGHIGYNIRPSERRKGYGTLILALTMEKAREMGLTRVLVTCDTDNIGSAKIIEKNGGVLASQGIDERTGKHKSRYWIEL